MAECDGCPDYQRRVEVYSNRDTGCGMEFYSEGTVDPTDPPKPPPSEPTTPEITSSIFLKSVSSIFAMTSAYLMMDF
jgi:hypothetical protein